MVGNVTIVAEQRLCMSHVAVRVHVVELFSHLGSR